MGDPALSSHLIRFGVFELDVRSGELRKGDVRLNLPDQPLQILSALLEHPGEIVSRDELRQRLWPSDTFVDFEHGLNAAVKRLRDVLGDSADTPRFIETVPKRGYRFVGAVTSNLPISERPREDVPAQSTGKTKHQLWWIVGGLTALAAVAGLAWIERKSPPIPVATTTAPMRLLPLTTLPGSEFAGVLSPDGSTLAFMWNEGKGGPFTIYVETIGSSDIRRVSVSGVGCTWPAWAPDSRRVAYLRRRTDGTRRVYGSSLIDGSEELMSDLPVAPGGLDWSPDGRALAVLRAAESGDGPGNGRISRPTDEWDNTGIFVVPLKGGTPHRITKPVFPTQDEDPHFSPDGSHLAFASCGATCDIYVVDLTSALEAAAPPRRLAAQVGGVGRVAWSRDGTSLVYDTDVAPGLSLLWRVPLDGAHPPERVEFAGYIAHAPATARSADRLVFTRSTFNADIHAFEPDGEAREWFASSLFDHSPSFSTDGRRVVFTSERSGDGEAIWVADVGDPESAHQLTHLPNGRQGSPSWSPDGQRVAFDSKGPDGHWHIWTIDADGGSAQQLTMGPSDQNVPSWSSDGTVIYFTADRGSGRNLWRMAAAGGHEEQVTFTGTGNVVSLTVDGTGILYQASDARSPLLIAPLHEGTPRRLAACVEPSAFADTLLGTYYVGCSADANASEAPLYRLEKGSRHPRLLGVLKGLLTGTHNLAVSRDGRVVLYDRFVQGSADLMLIEHFK